MAPRIRNKLTARFVETVTKPGRHSDGGGLYLNVTKSGAKSWVFMWKKDGRRREMGLGSATGHGKVAVVSLSVARKKADEIRDTLALGGDPFVERRRANVPSFGAASEAFVDAMESSWRNQKHRNQWRQTLRVYCQTIRPLPVDEITTEHILSVLTPLWESKHDTASRLRGRMERVLDYAKTKGWRSGENPARWRGHLNNILPPRQKLTRGHYAAMDYRKIPSFLQKISHVRASSAVPLKFLILTAARTAEVTHARWEEIDLEKRIWTVPAERMKAAREHRVPLSDQAISILEVQRQARRNDFVFPGTKLRQPVSPMAMYNFLKSMVPANATVHGFRSSFRDWVGEETDYPRDLAEVALSHVVGDETERAYRRGDALERRRDMMQAWADFCLPLAKPATTIERLSSKEFENQSG